LRLLAQRITHIRRGKLMSGGLLDAVSVALTLSLLESRFKGTVKTMTIGVELP
jgi:hypothetical protein